MRNASNYSLLKLRRKYKKSKANAILMRVCKEDV